MRTASSQARSMRAPWGPRHSITKRCVLGYCALPNTADVGCVASAPRRQDAAGTNLDSTARMAPGQCYLLVSPKRTYVYR